MYIILLTLMLLDRSILPQEMFVSILQLTAAVPKRDVTLLARMARVFVPKRGFVTCDCETAEEAINILKTTWLGWAQIGI